MVQPVPAPLPGESVADQSLFSPENPGELPDDLRVQGNAVLRALELVEQGQYERANSELREIPRVSPFADWRMLVRGLTAWYENDFHRATEAWSRLDSNRRPSRIAAVLVVAANHAELTARPEGPVKPGESADAVFLARANLKMAEIVRTLRDRRPALQLARQMAAVKHRDSEMNLSASQIAMLIELREKFSGDEPLLVRQISDACIGLAFQQPEPELFALLTSRVPGPSHDPAWNLARSQYFEKFDGAEQVQAAALRKYLDVDLATASTVPEDLRRALTSLIWQNHGEEFLENTGAIWGGNDDNIRNARKSFDRSAEAWPQNRGAYQGLIDCEEKPAAMAVQVQPKKSGQDAINRKVARIRERWIRSIPDDVEPRLWLIDHYLQANNLARAAELVESLSKNRLDSFRLKMLPWKVCLFECLAKSRKKREIEQARSRLERAVATWPAWLSRDLIPFLHAAMEMRAGDTNAFAEKRQVAIDSTGLPTLVCDVMTLATLQMANVPSAELKPFRAPVELHVRQVTLLPTADLARLGGFYWDLMLTGLSYPAQKMHGSKFGEELCWRLSDESPPLDLPGLIESCLWMSAAQFYSRDSYNPVFPPWVFENRLKHPLLAASLLRSYRRRRFGSEGIRNAMPELKLVEQQARTEPDPLKRMVLEETAATARGILDSFSLQNPFEWNFSGAFQPSGLPELFDDDDEWDDEDDGWGDEDNGSRYKPARSGSGGDKADCQCPVCQAERSRSSAGKGGGNSRFRTDEPVFDMDSEVSLEAQVFLEQMGPEGIERLQQLMEEATSTGRNNMDEVLALVESRGVGRGEFLSVLAKGIKAGKKRNEEPEMSPEEKRDFRRRRKNPFDKKKKRR